MRLFTDTPDFYPTPAAVIEQMMMGEDFIGKTILEPSAGSGNIVDWLQHNGAGQVIACENDSILLKLLRDKCPILAEDFLTVTAEQVSHVDYIVMNPPFSHGAEHILHAFDIAPAGCTVIALCNSDNFSISYRNKTKDRLRETVELYGQRESLGDVFRTAERHTYVQVELVKLYKEGEGSNEFDGYLFEQYDTDAANGSHEGLMQYNFVRDIVNRYISAVRMFDEVMQLSKRINDVADFYDSHNVTDPKTGEIHQERQSYGALPIIFGAQTKGEHPTAVTHQQYKRELQKHYWHIIFQKLHMEKYATRDLRQQINRFIESQKCVPFTMKNIYKVLNIVVQTNGQRMMKALEEAFDLICSLSAENSTAGEKWKTNANYMINRRFIVDNITEGYFYGSTYERVNFPCGGGRSERMEDVCKALCYLTGRNYDEIECLIFVGRGQPWGKWFEWGFFRCRGYKKGTMHFEFLDENVWEKFNYEVAVYKSKTKGWDLPKKTTKRSKR